MSNKVTFIDSTKKLIEIFGKPDPENDLAIQIGEAMKSNMKVKWAKDTPTKITHDDMDAANTDLVNTLTAELAKNLNEDIDKEIIADLKYFQSLKKKKTKPQSTAFPSDDANALQQFASGGCDLDIYYAHQLVTNEKLPVVNGKAIIRRNKLIDRAITGKLTSNGLEVASLGPTPRSSGNYNLVFNVLGKRLFFSNIDYSTGEIELPSELCDSDGEMILTVNYEYSPE